MKSILSMTIAGCVAAWAAMVGAETPRFVDATPADNFKLHWVIRADPAPVLDGKLDDPIWQKAEPLQGWGITDYGRQNGKLGEIDFRACWDERYLYVGARMYHRRQPRDMDELRRKVGDISQDIYGRECLEVHIDGKLDHATRFQSIVNPLSEKMMLWHYDFGWGLLTNPDYGLDADWDAVAAYDKDSWTVEIRYALSDIQVQPRVGSMFGINPCWFDWADTREDSDGYWWQFLTWSTPGSSHHDPRLYGHFVLVEQKPADLEQGLRLAYPDLDKRTVMIQTDSGFLVFRNGKKEQENYDERVKAEAQATRGAVKRLVELFADRGATPDGYVKEVLEKQDAALKKIEVELAVGKGLTVGQLNLFRQDLATITTGLDNLYWSKRQDFLLVSLPAVKK